MKSFRQQIFALSISLGFCLKRVHITLKIEERQTQKFSEVKKRVSENGQDRESTCMFFDSVSLRYCSPNWLTGVHLVRVAFVPFRVLI